MKLVRNGSRHRNLVLAGGAAFSFLLIAGWVLFIPLSPGAKDSSRVVIEKGEGTKSIARNLKERGVIRSSLAFRTYALTIGASGSLQAGTYELGPGMSIAEIVERMDKGRIVKEKITVPEGWDVTDIAEALEEKGIFTSEEFLKVVGVPGVDYREHPSLPQPEDFSGEYAFLSDKPWYVSLEGYLFPDTYEVASGEEPEDLVRRMLDNFGEKASLQIRAAAARQGKSLFETVTMASLLEKEVPTLEDKKRVAGILEKRMREGMRLQVDATVNYIKDREELSVSIKDTQIESPFNTYRTGGLPLGPIANPGLESIKAALDPVATRYWYYLSASDGTTVYNETFEGHKRDKAIYLR